MESTENDAKIFPEAVALREFARSCSTLLGSVQSAQDPDCPATKELASARAPDLVETAFSQGSLLSLAARDQAEALVRSLTEPVLTIGPWPITRNLLEASAIGAWLLDPAIDAHERISRSFAFRHKGLMQQVKVARAAGSNVQSCEDSLDRVVTNAQTLGYPILRNSRGRIDAVAQRMPSITDLVGLVLQADVEYRIFSAVVHGHSWALMKLGLIDRGPAESQVLGQISHEFGKAIPQVAVKFACLRSGDALYRVHEYKARVFGVDLASLRESFEALQDLCSKQGDT